MLFDYYIRKVHETDSIDALVENLQLAKLELEPLELQAFIQITWMKIVNVSLNSMMDIIKDLAAKAEGR